MSKLSTYRFSSVWVIADAELLAALLNLHRTYFAQALRDQPNDLLRHRYGPSVMATYRSAWRLIEGLKQPTRRAPGLIAKHNLAWSHALSAAVCLSSAFSDWCTY